MAIKVTEDGGVTKDILQAGAGEVVPLHSTCLVQYIGRLADDGTEFYNSYKEGGEQSQPTTVVAGRDASMSQQGLYIGVGSMRKGEKCILHVAPEYGYGVKGNFSFPSVPPYSKLEYEVELIDFSPVEEGKPVKEMFFEERLEAAQRRRLEGNDLYKKGDLDAAINKYNMGMSYIDDEMMMQLQGFHLDRAEDVLGLLRLNLATVMLQKGEYQQVVYYTSQVLRHDESNAKAYYRRGKARLSMGQTEEAKKDLEKAQDLSPNDKLIVQALQEVKRTEVEERQAQAKLFKGKLPAQSSSAAASSQQQTQQMNLWSYLLFIVTWIMKMFGLKK
eukprot:TRINITY_DN5694_c1_g1_i4.p1 TRINITY_DN5694_c1_g1~~TRINITY_DN5694_c1_g1_i4.p1  ORF type:complete len:374 (-),score=52.22 TRINITY_DN5694_c1_g1_i4:200-1192(-)